MSYSLGISGHHGDPDKAEQIDALLREAGADLVEKLAALGETPANASFTGPTGFVNYLAADPAPEADDSTA